MLIVALESEGLTIPIVSAGESVTHRIASSDKDTSIVTSCSVPVKVTVTAVDRPEWHPISVLLSPYSSLEVVVPPAFEYDVMVRNHSPYEAADVHLVVARGY